MSYVNGTTNLNIFFNTATQWTAENATTIVLGATIIVAGLALGALVATLTGNRDQAESGGKPRQISKRDSDKFMAYLAQNWAEALKKGTGQDHEIVWADNDSGGSEEEQADGTYDFAFGLTVNDNNDNS